MDELVGQNLGQYHIEAKIGTGGMASVFKAYQANLERYVAIKVLPPAFASKNSIFVKRFEREAKSIARLHHPNILPVYDFGIDSDYSFIVMRYVEGAQTLGQLMPFSLSNERIVNLISQVASALTYAHQHGVIHRDVKPSNILLDGEWALLSDFGLARVEEAVSQITGSGMSIGTPAYMSPEQASGEIVDHTADIYSLGVIVYEMMTHTIPHNAPTPIGILMKRMTQPPPSPRLINPAISTSVEQVILRVLAVNPGDRYASASDFAAALKRVMTDGTSQAFTTASLDKKTMAIDAQPMLSSYSGKDSSAQKWPALLRRSIWPVTSVAVAITVLLLIWWAGNFRSPIPAVNQAEMVSPAAVAPRPTPTPTLTPAATSTNTPRPPTVRAQPPRETPVPSPSPTSTPAGAPAFPTAAPVVVVVTATATDTPVTTPTPTPGVLVPTPAATPSAPPSLPNGTFVLLNPLSLDKPSYGPTSFEWQWQGTVPPGFGFEVRVWREGEPPAGVHDAVLDNREGRIEKIGEDRYRLQVNIRQAAGVRERSGEYLWTVVLVQLSPTYSDLGVQAEPAQLRFEAGGGGGGEDSDGSGGGIF